MTFFLSFTPHIWYLFVPSFTKQPSNQMTSLTHAAQTCMMGPFYLLEKAY